MARPEIPRSVRNDIERRELYQRQIADSKRQAREAARGESADAEATDAAAATESTAAPAARKGSKS
jgi:hypothetical protein